MPHIDRVLRGAGEEHGGEVRVPHDGVDGGGVAGVLHQELCGELRGGQVDVPLLRADDEHVLIIRFEGDTSGSIHKMFCQAIPDRQLL